MSRTIPLYGLLQRREDTLVEKLQNNNYEISDFETVIIYQLTAGDRNIITSIDTAVVVVVKGGAEGALQNHQVLTGVAVHTIQYDGGKVCPKTA